MDLFPFFRFAVPVFFVAVILENFLSGKPKTERYGWPEVVTNLKTAVLAAVVKSLKYTLFVVVYFACYERFLPLRELLFGYTGVGFASYWWLVALLMDDLCYYWYHRLSHEVHHLWTFHAGHHPSGPVNGADEVRKGIMTALPKPAFYLLLPIIGFHPLMVIACQGVNYVYRRCCRTEMITPWERLASLLVTPQLQTLHHVDNEAGTGSNYAGIFCFYDQLFGTFRAVDHRQDRMPESKWLRDTFGIANASRTAGLTEVERPAQRSWRR